MKTFMKWSMMTLLVVLTMCMFTACGGNGDDDLLEAYVKTSEGVHRIEVSFDGDTDGWKVSLLFIAVYADSSHGKVKMYEDGNKVGMGSYQAEELRSYSVETEKKCDQMNVAISASRNSKDAGKSMIVTLKSYINGKQVKSKTVTISANEYYRSIIFDSELDADVL